MPMLWCNDDSQIIGELNRIKRDLLQDVSLKLMELKKYWFLMNRDL